MNKIIKCKNLLLFLIAICLGVVINNSSIVFAADFTGHSLSNGTVPVSSDLESYIEEAAAENIVLYTQASFMLAEEIGFYLDSHNGTQIPLNFSADGTQEGYDQRAYLYASQMMNWGR